MENTPQPAPQPTPAGSRKAVIIVVIIGAVLAAAYLAQTYFFSPERIGEYVLERALEQGGQGAYEVDMDGAGNVSITGSEGETYSVTTSSAGGTTLPAEWPAEIALPPSAVITFAATAGVPTQGTILTVTHSDTQSPDVLATWYKTQLENAGWKIEMQATTPEGALVTATRPGTNMGFMANITVTETGSDVGLTYSAGTPN